MITSLTSLISSAVSDIWSRGVTPVNQCQSSISYLLKHEYIATPTAMTATKTRPTKTAMNWNDTGCSFVLSTLTVEMDLRQSHTHRPLRYPQTLKKYVADFQIQMPPETYFQFFRLPSPKKAKDRCFEFYLSPEVWYTWKIQQQYQYYLQFAIAILEKASYDGLVLSDCWGTRACKKSCRSHMWERYFSIIWTSIIDSSRFRTVQYFASASETSRALWAMKDLCRQLLIVTDLGQIHSDKMGRKMSLKHITITKNLLKPMVERFEKLMRFDWATFSRRKSRDSIAIRFF